MQPNTAPAVTLRDDAEKQAMPLFFWLPMIMLSGMARVFNDEASRTAAAFTPRKPD
jgi:hypothetical protein